MRSRNDLWLLHKWRIISIVEFIIAGRLAARHLHWLEYSGGLWSTIRFLTAKYGSGRVHAYGFRAILDRTSTACRFFWLSHGCPSRCVNLNVVAEGVIKLRLRISHLIFGWKNTRLLHGGAFGRACLVLKLLALGCRLLLLLTIALLAVRFHWAGHLGSLWRARGYLNDSTVIEGRGNLTHEHGLLAFEVRVGATVVAITLKDDALFRIVRVDVVAKLLLSRGFLLLAGEVKSINVVYMKINWISKYLPYLSKHF